MNIAVKPGKYVVAVSGGVDSMVLLDLLACQPDLDLVVAHFEHGIREDSDLDQQLVAEAAKQYNFPYIYERGQLGAGTSEAQARTARYAFLRRVKEHTKAAAIITAHHQDDVIETAIINVLRGTGRKGLSALGSNEGIVRPLLQVRKRDLLAYAGQHNLMWHEDSTNNSDTYLRNYIRHHLIGDLGEQGRALLLEYIERAAHANPLIDSLLLHEINAHQTSAGLARAWFIMQPYDVSCEIMAAWLRCKGVRNFDRKTIERLVIAAKVDKPGNVRDVNAGYLLKVRKAYLELTKRTIAKTE